MGLIRNLAKKVLRRPGAPRPPDGAPPPSPGPADNSPTGTPAPTGAAATDKPWYLDGSNDGWDTTDVKKE
jgi:hypothetical protein